MQKSWESYIDVGIVLPKLFSGIADDKERFSQGLMTILKDPFLPRWKFLIHRIRKSWK